MATTTVIHSLTNHLPHVRVKYKTTLDDGRSIVSASIRSANATAAAAYIPTIQAILVSQMEDIDADEVIDVLGTVGSNKTASAKKVAKRYLKRAMQSNSLEAYEKLNAFNDYRIAQGWTPAQVKAQLNLTNAQFNDIISRFTYLNSNSTKLDDYKVVIDGDVWRLEL